MDKLKVLELFGGIGACSKALERLGIDYEIADYVEIDKYAVASFNAMHGTNFEPQDICKWNKDIKVDLIMHGSPCQDFSVAGKGAGGDKDSGTRSSLMYETIRIVEKLKPKYVIWENVKNLLSKKHKHNFDAYLETMEQLGYKNYYQVLNAKDYGIPQNRERVFTISIRDDIEKEFIFPKKQELKLRLKDMLEDTVDEKYYLSDEKTRTVFTYSSYVNKKYDEFIDKNGYVPEMFNPYNKTEIKDVAPTLTAQGDSITKSGTVLKCVRISGIFDTEKTKHQAGSIYDKEGLSPTLDVMQGGWRQPSIINNYRIRKLTPKECWRLMGFSDADFQKAEKVNSNTQLYKQAGNSIVVDVLVAIFKQLFNI